MERAVGIGGVFFRAKDPHALQEWYVKHLGLDPDTDGYVVFRSGPADGPERRAATVWAPFDEDTDYFGPSGQRSMVNYRVANLDRMLEQLRSAGAEVDERVMDSEFGRFGWANDGEGNRFELWEPPPGE